MMAAAAVPLWVLRRENSRLLLLLRVKGSGRWVDGLLLLLLSRLMSTIMGDVGEEQELLLFEFRRD